MLELPFISELNCKSEFSLRFFGSASIRLLRFRRYDSSRKDIVLRIVSYEGQPFVRLSSRHRESFSLMNPSTHRNDFLE